MNDILKLRKIVLKAEQERINNAKTYSIEDVKKILYEKLEQQKA